MADYTGSEAWDIIVSQMGTAGRFPEFRSVAEESLNGWFDCVEGVLRSGGKIRAIRNLGPTPYIHTVR